MHISDRYQGLSTHELLDKAGNLGARYIVNSGSCGQSTVAALHDVLGFDDVLVKASTSFCGGMAEQFLGICGALAGGIMILDSFYGRPIEKMSAEQQIKENQDAMKAAWQPTELLCSKFVDEHGSLICAHIHRRYFGRIYYLRDSDEIDKFFEAGGLNTVGKIVGNVVRWVLEILLDKEATDLKI